MYDAWRRNKATPELQKRENDAYELAQHTCDVMNTLAEYGLNEFNKKSTFKWKHSGEYTYSRIIDTRIRPFCKGRKIINDLQDASNYYKVITLEDTRLFEALQEANIYIVDKTLELKNGMGFAHDQLVELRKTYENSVADYKAAMG
jgi:hypothetical protein